MERNTYAKKRNSLPKINPENDSAWLINAAMHEMIAILRYVFLEKKDSSHWFSSATKKPKTKAGNLLIENIIVP